MRNLKWLGAWCFENIDWFGIVTCLVAALACALEQEWALTMAWTTAAFWANSSRIEASARREWRALANRQHQHIMAREAADAKTIKWGDFVAQTRANLRPRDRAAATRAMSLGLANAARPSPRPPA